MCVFVCETETTRNISFLLCASLIIGKDHLIMHCKHPHRTLSVHEYTHLKQPYVWPDGLMLEKVYARNLPFKMLLSKHLQLTSFLQIAQQWKDIHTKCAWYQKSIVVQSAKRYVISCHAWKRKHPLTSY